VQAQAVRLGDIAKALDVLVNVHCEGCGQPLGRYSAGLRYPQGDFVVLSEGISRLEDFGSAKLPKQERSQARALGSRGPRTQPGLYRETHGEQVYLRKRCTCP
jgi:hypothetical protein